MIAVVRAAQLLAAVAVLDLAWRARHGYRWYLDNLPSHNCEETT